jgi:hypothetical protein
MAKLPWIGLGEEVDGSEAGFLLCPAKEAACAEQKTWAAMAYGGAAFGRVNALAR